MTVIFSAIMILGDNMKFNRLFEITTILLNKGSITAKELADRFGVSTRTIYRDIDTLSAAGVPVYMNKGSGGGISLLDHYAMSRTLITEEESESLLLAVKTLQATQYPEVDIVLEKMGALFKHAVNYDWVEVDFSPWGSMPNEKNKFNDIKRAMLQRQVIRFDYVNADGHKSSRLAEPEKLIFKGNAWYLVAYCQQRMEARTFRISRLKNLEITSETFVRKPKSSTDSGRDQEASAPDVQLRLRFQAKVLNRLYDYFDDSYIVKKDDDFFIIEIALPAGEWIYSYILSFGSAVEVLEPEHIRNTLVQRMKQALKFYEPREE
ncbi:DeoR family transcriptional regulator [Sporomusaceae bacterium FL31]|nr:DeoR family transcriptional regulator [Sporomusaceae bacterium FL31]GCE34465.1 DeoR family transcriptional regulator [Sporomusaceae bacterium]